MRGPFGKEGWATRAAIDLLVARSALAGWAHHLLAVIEPGGSGAGGHRVPQQQTAATADLEQAIAVSETERVEDRAPREVVHVIGSVDRACTTTYRPARDPIGQPVNERSSGLPALLSLA
jgi:hypothetical protein